ncbi:MAG: ATP-dependent DNA helicase RecG [Syntrophales bacterium]
MESLFKIIEKLEAPLLFAEWNSYRRLALVKNLEEVVTSLLKQLRGIIQGKGDETFQIADSDIHIKELSNLFSDFETLSSEKKKERISKAITILAELKRIFQKAFDGQRIKTAEKGINKQKALSEPINFLAGIGPRLASLFARKDIKTVEDLLYFLPRRYEDRRNISLIAETVPGIKQIVIGRVVQAELRFYGRKKVFEALVEDSSGVIKAKWFKGRELFLRNAFKPEARVILAGEIAGFPFEREIIHPEFEILNDSEDQLLHFKRIVPVYSETPGLAQKTIRRIIWKTVRDFAAFLRSPIPEEILRRRLLMEFSHAFRMVHFPDNEQNIELYQQMRSEAHRRLIYDEFFFFQLGMALRKRGQLLEEGISFDANPELLHKLSDILPFSLTAAQMRVIREIRRDMASPSPMNRLLQGDVGSGKTIVATAAAVIACANGYQAAIMAPTEILAEQHFRNMSKLLDGLGIACELLTGNMTTSRKAEVLMKIENGQSGIVVGTHALIQGKVVFNKLGLAVIDEQHRFGVVQRAALRKKGQIPDVLVMTATPIPRTLAMTVYGDLDVSVIDEMPPGKQPTLTKVFSESQRARVYETIRREVEKGKQVFIVYPLVEASETLDLKDAVCMEKHLRDEVFPDISVGLVHGRMKINEKEQVMSDFSQMKIMILVATTVIEVGIDIPAASLMVIEHAERFGLSQLHQLRGRVGRGGTPAYCILLAQKPLSADARKRLRIMEETNDGFRVAEEDLAIRGPGEFMGTRQSGLPDFRIANIARDGRILAEAKEDAFSVVDGDPHLTEMKHAELKETLFSRWEGRFSLAKTG